MKYLEETYAIASMFKEEQREIPSSDLEKLKAEKNNASTIIKRHLSDEDNASAEFVIGKVKKRLEQLEIDQEVLKNIDIFKDYFLFSENDNFRKAKRYYNGRSCYNGSIGISFGYYWLMRSPKCREVNLDLIAYVLFHEIAHHKFRIVKESVPEEMKVFVSHVNELYADYESVKMLGFDENKINKICTKLFIKNILVWLFPDKLHPKGKIRKEIMKRGVFNLNTLKLIACEVDKRKRVTNTKDYIGDVKEIINIFEEKHGYKILEQ